jgi:hypothetical protein
MNSDAPSDDTPMRVSQTLPQIGHCVLYTPYDANEKTYDLDLASLPAMAVMLSCVFKRSITRTHVSRWINHAPS